MAVQPALRKRQQISQANRTMLLWVAAASIVVVFSLMASWFLWQKLLFNEKVLAEKEKTASILRDNNQAVEELQNNVRRLNTNQALGALKPSDGSRPVQVVLDALPADANSLALGSSIQNKLVKGVEGVTLEALSVTPVSGVESGQDGTVQDANNAGVSSVGQVADAQPVSFTLRVSGDANALKDFLKRVEQSIRVVTVNTLVIEQQSGNRLSMTLNAQAYYQPAKTVDLKDKVVKP